MLIPDGTDPNWMKVIRGEKQLKYDFLATRVLVGRLGLVHTLDPSPETTRKSIAELRQFFERNKEIPKVQADLAKIFGNEVTPDENGNV